jgi:DNA-binding NtrC family response regulator
VERLMPLRDFVRQVERHYILDVLGLHHGVKSRACERLQISRQTLYTKLSHETDGEREGA